MVASIEIPAMIPSSTGPVTRPRSVAATLSSAAMATMKPASDMRASLPRLPTQPKSSSAKASRAKHQEVSGMQVGVGGPGKIAWERFPPKPLRPGLPVPGGRSPEAASPNGSPSRSSITRTLLEQYSGWIAGIFRPGVAGRDGTHGLQFEPVVQLLTQGVLAQGCAEAGSQSRQAQRRAPTAAW